MKYKLSINDVAVKQLESAIWMYAYGYDEVAVHTIAGAAFELYTKRLKLIDFKSSMLAVLKPDKYKEFIDLWNRPYNFFKHGEFKKTPIDEFIYEEETVEMLIYFASEANLLGADEYQLKCSQIFKAYFIINHPEMIDAEIYKGVYEKNAEQAGLSIEKLKTKESLRTMLNISGHTFVNGTNTPYTDLKK